MSSRKCRECGKELLIGESECNWCAPVFAEQHAQGYVCETCGSRLPDGRTCPFCAQHTIDDVEALTEDSAEKQENFLSVSLTVIAGIAGMFALPFIVAKLDPIITFIAFALIVALSVAFSLASRARALLRDKSTVAKISWLKDIETDIRNHNLAASIAAKFFYLMAFLFLTVTITLVWYLLTENPNLRAIRQYIPIFMTPLFILSYGVRAFVRSYIRRNCT